MEAQRQEVHCQGSHNRVVAELVLESSFFVSSDWSPLPILTQMLGCENADQSLSHSLKCTKTTCQMDPCLPLYRYKFSEALLGFLLEILPRSLLCILH